jgi:copper chaperone
MHRFKVQNMACGGCARSVIRAVQSVEPNADVEVDLGSKTVTVSRADGQADRIA